MDADVIVIGAGAAGLAAARYLAEHSLRTIVVEARDRVGGRAWSDSAKSGPVTAELGAEYIHGPAPETLALLREMRGAHVDVGDDSWDFDGAELHPRGDDFVAAAAIFEPARSLPNDVSVEQYLHRFDGDESMRATVDAARAFVEGFEAADPADASARAIADEWCSGVDDDVARPLGGYRPVLEHLRDACEAAGARFMLSTSARRIVWSPGNVEIETVAANGEAGTLRARAAIVTLPVGVLRHAGDATAIAFEPELPAAKREALEHIEMGHAVRVGLWFESAFWENLRDGRYRDAAFFRTKQLAFTAYWTQVPIRSRLIVAWVGGPKARRTRRGFARRTDRTRARRLRNDARRARTRTTAIRLRRRARMGHRPLRARRI